MVAVTKQLFEAVGLTTDWITQYSVTPTSSVPTILTETVPPSLVVVGVGVVALVIVILGYTSRW